jgi:hypothetical protein
MVTFTNHKTQIRTIRQGDDNFVIKDGLTVSPRAGFEISNSCPNEYKSILITAINAGWIKPVASVHERELLFIGLTK